MKEFTKMASAVLIPKAVKSVLRLAGWEYVGTKTTHNAAKVARLQYLLSELYVDNRRQRAVENLTEARELANEL